MHTVCKRRGDVGVGRSRGHLGRAQTSAARGNPADPVNPASPVNGPGQPPCPQVNAATVGDQHLGEFFHVASMLVPLYAPRAAEVAFFGPDGASLATAAPLSDCFEIG